MRLIDADMCIEKIKDMPVTYDSETVQRCIEVVSNAPTIDAVPTEFVMENCNLDFVCDELTDDGEWCSERCQYSEPQPECIHRYIDRIWRTEHGRQ